jgi:hypothetical protein
VRDFAAWFLYEYVASVVTTSVTLLLVAIEKLGNQ